MDSEFTIYLSSLGSLAYFPDNDNSAFSNLLQTPLTDMKNYRVGLAGCYISSAKTTDTILVCSNIVSPSLFNDKQMPVVGVHSAKQILYHKLAMETIYTITCTLVDANGVKISLDTPPLIALHFSKL